MGTVKPFQGDIRR